MMPIDRGVLTTEFKINLLAAATGERIIARGKVVKAGRTLTLAQARNICRKGRKGTVNRSLTATLMAIEGRQSIAD